MALIVGRALESQQFFNNVSWNLNLRDNKTELYEFAATNFLLEDPIESDDQCISEPVTGLNYPIGIFTPLTTCFSSTCSDDNVCYSYSCPRKSEKVTVLILEYVLFVF